MIATEPRSQTLNGTGQAGPELERAIRDYVLICALLHGRARTAAAFDVSRHTLWRFLNRGHTGRAIPRVEERDGP